MDISIIPESAPFNTEQRAWLNGFLAGWLGLDAGARTQNPAAMLASAPAALVKPEAEPAPEPWHDPALPIVERLKLADGEPLPRRLMAAMAQLDCGACGYLCRSYSAAIADGSESRLSLCSPGGSETSKALKRLLKETPAEPKTASSSPSANGNGKAASTNGVHVNKTSEISSWSRERPFTARILKSVNLNRPGSEKETRHVEIELGTDGPSYSVGDSLGVYPENCEALAEDLIAAIGRQGDEPVRLANGSETSLRIALLRECCLSEVTEGLLEQMADSTKDADTRARLKALIDDDSPISGFDVLDVLHAFPSARPLPEEFVASLAPLKPRLYSISSSPKRHAGQVHLTVRRVGYEFNGRQRKGVASTMLADRVESGTPLRVFVQKSHGFSLPADPEAATVLIGPGTGIAPFRAFLHERDVVGAKGKNWLFFGDQRSEFDFLYQEELSDFLRRGLLTRLDTAFSRDQGVKVYVQDRLRENGAELYSWLQSGAHVYVCGDAKRMAADVDRALREVIRDHGRVGEDDAKGYIARLAAEGRYLRDIY